MLDRTDFPSDRASTWKGRFPHNEILSLLTMNRALNLAESTSQDLHVGELLDLVGPDAVRSVRLGYGSAQGLPLLREAVGTLCGITHEQVLATTGTALGLYLLAVELCRPGDEVVLMTPCFPPSRDALLGAGVTVREVPLRFEDGYRVDLASFEAALRPKTRMVSLATPQNPSGVATDAATIDAMLEVMARCAPNAKLFIDETYRDATYGATQTPSSMAARDPRIITGASVSKAYGAPGLRVGWLTVPDRDLMERLVTAKMNVVISGSPLDETLAAHLLAKRELVLEPRRDMLAKALQQVSNWIETETNRIEWVRPDGGALCCVRLRAEAFGSSAIASFWAAQEARDLQLACGSWFGETDSVFRLGFGYLPLDRLNAALSAVSDAMDAAEAEA